MAGRTSRSGRGDTRIDGALLALALLISIIALAMPDDRADAIAGALRRSVLAPLMGLQERAERGRRALSGSDSATIAVDSLVLHALDANQLAAENAVLRAQLGLTARLRTGFVAAEALHGPALGEEYTLLLNAGRAAGIEPFSPVVAPQGLVGYVRSVDAGTSVAIVWPHPDFRVSAIADSGFAAGIVSAHLGGGASRYLLQLRGVPFRTPLLPGMRIVSSGVGGTFPRGIPIGTVLDTLPSEEGWARNYLIQPAVNAADVGAVLVLTDPRLRPDLRGIWPRPDSTRDSTQKLADSTRKTK